MGKFIDGMLQMHKNFCDTLLGEEKMREMKLPPLVSEFAKNAPTKDTVYTLEYTKGKKKEGKRISEVRPEQPKEKSNGTIRYVLPTDEESKELLAKKVGRHERMNPTEKERWDSYMKLQLMERLLLKKFDDRHPQLQQMLLATGDEELVEGNYWGDTYWGVCNGVGENHLGKLLMKIRDQLKAK